jgi:hypothetical protein
MWQIYDILACKCKTKWRVLAGRRYFLKGQPTVIQNEGENQAFPSDEFHSDKPE